MIGASPYPQPFGSPIVGLQGIPKHIPPKPKEDLRPKEAHLPRYVNYLADYSGCGHWRILWPESVINSRGDGMSQSTTAMVTDPRWYQGIKTVKVQRQASS